jgi:dihydrofolate synthase / folylpolyglutamate synthase
VSYPDSVRYLYSLGNELRPGAKFGLERIQTLLSALGNPERAQRFVHVAGTNGKGSSSAMIASMLRHANLRTGLYTSPHLIEPTERIQIDGADIDAQEFTASFQTVQQAAEKLLLEEHIDAHPSYFETITAMALLIFGQRADISVLEVGLGGRLDATNVIIPELCVITPVSYDHEAFLGNSLDSIAGEKAGILKPGVPLVMGLQPARAESVITQRARELGCPIASLKSADIRDLHCTSTGSSFEFQGFAYECPLAARHQIENAATAILAGQSLGLPSAAISDGLRHTRWPGRLEFISHAPDFVLDGAHNPAGARALAAYIREFHSGRPVWIVYGAMRDKAIEEVTEQLFPLAQRLILTAPDFPRALRPEAILEIASYSGAVLTETVSQAIEAARQAPREAIVFFTGSLYLVGQARKLLLNK